MISKLVVSPGMARSGTTYLHAQFVNQNREFFNVPERKETNFFDRPRPADEFRAMTPAGYDEEKYGLDYSPGYLISRSDWVENLLSFPAAEKKAIFHLRNPVDQIFAHYLHDIKSHWAKRQHGDDVDRPLFRINTLARYLGKRANAVRRLVSELGRENILVINFYKDIPAAEATTTRVGKFLDLPLQPFSEQVVGPGGWTPHYVYGGESGVNIVVGTEIRRLPARSLLLVSCSESMVWHDVDQTTASRLIAGSSSWTREVTPEQFDVLYQFVRDDWLAVLEALGEREEDYEVNAPLRSRAPFLNGLSSDLSFQGSLGSILPQAAFEIQAI